VTPNASAPEPTTSPATIQTYDGRADGFTLNYPSTWTARPKDSDGNLVGYLVRLKTAYEPEAEVWIARTDNVESFTADMSCELLKGVAKQSGNTARNQRFVDFAGKPGCEVLSSSFLSVTKWQTYVSNAGFLLIAGNPSKTQFEDRLKSDINIMVTSVTVVR
jgi:hypothetical protein